MNFVSDHDFSNLGIVTHGLNSCFFSPHLKDTHKMMEISPLEGFSKLNYWAYSSNQLCSDGFSDLENLDLDFSLPPLGEDLEEHDQKPFNIVVPQGFHCNQEKKNEESVGDALLVMENVSTICVKKEEVQSIDQIQRPLPLPGAGSKKKKSSSCALEFDEIKEHFNVPINDAAKHLNVGLTMLKRRCRELNIMRWPHRKLKSLQLLIDNVKKLGLAKEVSRLEKHKRLIEKLPGMELSEDAKKLRQTCFKANYNKRRSRAL